MMLVGAGKFRLLREATQEEVQLQSLAEPKHQSRQMLHPMRRIFHNFFPTKNWAETVKVDFMDYRDVVVEADRHHKRFL